MGINLKLSIKNRRGEFGDFWKPDEPAGHQDRFTSRWNLSPKIGTGSYSRIELRPGFDLYIADYVLRDPIVIMAKCPAMFGFGFMVSGSIRSRISGIKDDFVMKSGQSELFYFPHQDGSGEETNRKHTLGISLFIEPDLFRTLIQEDFSCMPDDFPNVINTRMGKNFYHTDTISPSMQATLHQIFNCPYSGSTGRLYLEGKTIELIACKLGQLELCRNKTGNKIVLRPDDIDRIHYARDLLARARDLLARDMEHPPRLIELARAVGLTHNKLAAGFREVFETTPFNYLRDLRLCRAKLLLDEGMMNVTEAAFSVGYSSLSHFAKTFKQYFGIAPGTYLREVNKNRIPTSPVIDEYSATSAHQDR
jgi:AraC-like DNA-binding protein